MISAPIRILIVAALCIAGLIALVVRESAARDAGVEVVLPMEAVDPRAVLQGHYVRIDLRDALEAGAPCPSTNAGPGDDAGWVALAGEDGIHHVVRAAGLREEAAAPGAVLVRGGMSCEEATPGVFGIGARPALVTLDLGITQFYLDQAGAERIERVLREQRAGEASRVFAIISVGEDGRARLKGLLVDGARLELGWT